MNKKSIALAGIATTLLAACLTPAEQKAADSRECEGYGFAPGSDAFANCMMTIANRRADQMRHWQDEQNRKWQEQQTHHQNAASPVPEAGKMHCSTRETSTTTGNTTNVHSSTSCTSF